MFSTGFWVTFLDELEMLDLLFMFLKRNFITRLHPYNNNLPKKYFFINLHNF